MTGQRNDLNFIHLQMFMHLIFGCQDQFQLKFYIMFRKLSQDILFQCKIEWGQTLLDLFYVSPLVHKSDSPSVR